MNFYYYFFLIKSRVGRNNYTSFVNVSRHYIVIIMIIIILCLERKEVDTFYCYCCCCGCTYRRRWLLRAKAVCKLCTKKLHNIINTVAC